MSSYGVPPKCSTTGCENYRQLASEFCGTHQQTQPAQSDAPSAEPMSAKGFYHTYGVKVPDLYKFAEAYAALRTAQADAEAEHHAEISRQSQLAELAATKRAETAEAKVAQLEREHDEKT